MSAEQFPIPKPNTTPSSERFYSPEAERRVLEAAALKAKEVISRSRFDPADFVDLYGAENIAADQAKIDSIRAEILSRYSEEDLRTESVAAAFQGFFADRITSGLLGANGRAFHTSEYDDVINGIDVVSEVIDEEQQVGHLGFAVDVTFGQMKLGKKFSDIRSEISANQLARIKYFRSDEIGHRGEFRVPRFVVGLDRGHLLPLLDGWVSNRTDPISHGASGMLILKEIETQASVFGEFAKAQKQDALLRRYQRIEKTISEARQKLRKESGISILPKTWQQDRIAGGIDQQLAAFKK